MIPPSLAETYAQHKQVRTFIERLNTEHQFDRDKLVALFESASRRDDVLEAYAKPAERHLNWAQYRRLFVTESRIQQGVVFWREHRALLAKAEKKFAVPAEIIVAILGVETRYGEYKGRYPVFDSLVTLAFDGPRRQSFFLSELEDFLLLCRQHDFNPLAVKGSYAGAMGLPQFISSSYRNYAIDFDHSGTADLFSSIADVVGSVANYFVKHGWREGQMIAVEATVAGDLQALAAGRGRNKLKPTQPMRDYRSAGAVPRAHIPDNESVILVHLDNGKDAGEYWFGRHNFYVITRYNHSAMYAMAVYQLSQAIREAMTR